MLAKFASLAVRLAAPVVIPVTLSISVPLSNTSICNVAAAGTAVAAKMAAVKSNLFMVCPRSQNWAWLVVAWGSTPRKRRGRHRSAALPAAGLALSAAAHDFLQQRVLNGALELVADHRLLDADGRSHAASAAKVARELADGAEHVGVELRSGLQSKPCLLQGLDGLDDEVHAVGLVAGSGR